MTLRPASRLIIPLLACATLLAGCSEKRSRNVQVSVIGTPEQLAKPLANDTTAAGKLMLEATAQGLVGFDAQGDILPGLAQRWIVQDNGRSYIFRVRRAKWPDGQKVDADGVVSILKSRIRANIQRDPMGALSAISAVNSMTSEVIEIDLGAPRPNLLQLLAQPQMGIISRDGGTGPYRAVRQKHFWILTPIPDPAADPQSEDGTEEEDAIEPWQVRILRAERAAKAIVRYRMGYADLVLGGRFTDVPLLARADLNKRDVRVDPVDGLFGLAFTGKGKFFEDPKIRQALNMAIDRDRLPTAFALGGWAVRTTILNQQLDLPGAPTQPDWAGMTMDDRRAQAQASISIWRADHDGQMPVVRISMPAGTGAKLLFNLISSDFNRIGVQAQLAKDPKDADLVLIDEVAPYDSAAWYLSRIDCARGISCDRAAEEQLRQAAQASSVEERDARLGDAEALFVAHGGFIPLAAPVRWSLVSSQLNGFSTSPRARHPLNQLFRASNSGG